MYADDVVVFAPSVKGLQKILEVCYNTDSVNDVNYNSDKSKVMLFGNKSLRGDCTISLGSTDLEIVSNYKYLGHYIGANLDDEMDMKSKERAFYARSNVLLRKFYFCTFFFAHNVLVYSFVLCGVSSGKCV